MTRREVPAQVVAVAPLPGQHVLDQPVGAVDEDHAPAVDRLVDGRADLAVEDVEPVARVAAEERRLGAGQRGARARVGRLVGAVDRHRVVRRGAAEPVAQVRLALGVGEAARVQHQRLLARPRLDAERVVVAVAAVAQRPAVEDQVAARPRAGRSSRRRGSSRGPAGARARSSRASSFARQAQQLAVVARVAVRQRRDRAVGAAHVVREVARAAQPLVEARGQRDVEAAAVLARADERAQGDHVVVRAALAVHAVGAEVGQQVGVQLARRQLLEAGDQVRQRERGEQQRVELERAVVALVRQVVAHVDRLVAQALDERLADRRLRQPLPGVDPVQDPARGDLGRVVVGRDLRDEARHQPLPRVEVAAVAGGAERVREVEPVIELDPVDPPFLVVGQRGAVQPVRLEAEPHGLAGERELAARDGVGQRAVAMLVLVDAQHRARAERRLQTRSSQRLPEQVGERVREAVAVEARRAPSRARCRSAGASARGRRAGAGARRPARAGHRARPAGR